MLQQTKHTTRISGSGDPLRKTGSAPAHSARVVPEHWAMRTGIQKTTHFPSNGKDAKYLAGQIRIFTGSRSYNRSSGSPRPTTLTSVTEESVERNGSVTYESDTKRRPLLETPRCHNACSSRTSIKCEAITALYDESVSLRSDLFYNTSICLTDLARRCPTWAKPCPRMRATRTCC